MLSGWSLLFQKLLIVVIPYSLYRMNPYYELSNHVETQFSRHEMYSDLVLVMVAFLWTTVELAIFNVHAHAVISNAEQLVVDTLFKIVVIW